MRDNEERFRFLFENSPVALFEQDYSKLKVFLEKIKSNGVIDLYSYFNIRPEEIYHCVSLIRVSAVNNYAINDFGAEEFKYNKGLFAYLIERDEIGFLETIIALANGETSFSREGAYKNEVGEKIYMHINFLIPPGYEATWEKVLVSAIDITEIKLREENLFRRVLDLEILQEATSNELATYKEDESFLSVISGQLATTINKARSFISEKEQSLKIDVQHDISKILNDYVVLDNAIEPIFGVLEKTISFDRGGVFIKENNDLRWVSGKGYKNIHAFSGNRISSVELLINEVIEKNTIVFSSDPQNDPRFEIFKEIQESNTLNSWIGVPLIDDQRVIGVLTIERHTPMKFSASDANRVQAFAKQATAAILKTNLHTETRRKLNRVQSLNQLGKLVSRNVDLNKTLEASLRQLNDNLNIDASAILLFNRFTGMLEYSTSLGFTTTALRFTQLGLGVGLAGKAAKTQEIIHVKDEKDLIKAFFRSPHFKEEKFKAYSCIPLVAKSELKGVIEIFNRSPFEQTTDWLDFLTAFATQIAIAIDSNQLFRELQKNNKNLKLSHDSTLEGWAKALEMKGYETFGHSDRVTKLLVELAQEMGIEGEELLNARRGALLHDIGKMNVPNSILQKPDKLTKEEWEIVRQHPLHAYNYLSQIKFLKPALDIPYCHHEKWDGTGYPQGLKGDEIPLSARIFAIIDVYDALISDQPYRLAWSKEKTLIYIEEQSGAHFDPKVTEVFLRLISKRNFD